MADPGFHESDKEVLSRAWKTKYRKENIKSGGEGYNFEPEVLLEAAGKLYEPILHNFFSRAINGLKTWLNITPSENFPFVPTKRDLEKIMGDAQKEIKGQGLLDKEIAIAHERAEIIQNIAKKSTSKSLQMLTAEDLAAANLVYDCVVDHALEVKTLHYAESQVVTYKKPVYPETELHLESVRPLSSVILDQLRENLPEK